jgi:dTDP-4-dehydrorhamnose 3,5-epimerase/CDP-3, 6-dideoxy-D-glycero-D-glycero-4-hexulose-5-epimerase
MVILKELLPGCLLLKPMKFQDHRGCFVKTYHEEFFSTFGVSLQVREEFYSISHKNVLRGMHFQLPPNEHEKMVYCTRGAVKDVLLDLRQGDGYGRVATAELTGENSHLLFIPKGIAHGFVALTDESLMLYKTSSVHVPESDCGIRWDSFEFDWCVGHPIISERDLQHIAFGDFDSPFR